MRKKSLILAAAILAFAQPGANAESRMSAHEVPDAPHMPETREITDTLKASSVTGLRPLKETGVNRTEFDSLALKENISLSLADILTYNSSLFVKQYGRSSMSTVSFRGTSASHTQVLWNGMKINSPMLGMTDFSMIPSYFMDEASLLHGTSSLQAVGGGLGGAVILNTKSPQEEGFNLQYIQGFGSFLTADEFLKMTYGGKRFKSSTKLFLSTSENKFKYVNMDKKEVRYDENMNIIESWHPVEEYESGAWRDFHAMQELSYDTPKGHKFSLSAWYLDSYRQLPQLSVDYGDNTGFLNEQRESTLRAVASWKKSWTRSKAEVSAGYSGTALDYDYARDKGDGTWVYMTKSRSKVNTVYAKGSYEHYLGDKWYLTGNVSVHQHFVKSADESIVVLGNESAKVGYDASRTEISAFVSAKWKPWKRVGLSLSFREDMFGSSFSPVIPAFNADVLLSEKWNLYLKGSVSRNYRFPTLNDLYFMPGGNPDLKPESGFSYDAGYSLSRKFGKRFSISAEGYWFDSWIDDWILWVPNGAKKDFYTPMNVSKVHAYGVEQKLGAEWQPAEDWKLTFNGNFTWSPSINCGEPRSAGDESVGKQLVYIPEFSSSFIASLHYRKWSVAWKWCWYSRRYTMTSNDYTISGSVPPYFMNDLTLNRAFDFRWAGLSVSAAIKNLFNEKYLSVLARPMPGINFEIFVGITPKFGKRDKK